jgi:tRNA-dihydrouridine synthase B
MKPSPLFAQLRARNVTMEPALFCAPLAGLTHSAFRRVTAEMFGGCGAYYTEMLSGKSLLREDLQRSPYVRRSAAEPRLVFQLMLSEKDPVPQIIERLGPLQPDGLDLNLGCHAPMIRKLDAGARLFENERGLRTVLGAMRRAWPGWLSVKIRLGSQQPGWEQRLAERLKWIEDAGVDAVAVHLRYFEDKFKRRARHELLPWMASLIRLPLIANGDVRGPQTVQAHPEYFQNVQGIMIGRMAIVQPWIFAAWGGPVRIDYRAVWERMFEAIQQDFRPEQAIGRIKVFTHYYARNFRFGHRLAVAIQNARTLNAVGETAARFFDRQPESQDDPPLGGL